jgi:alpha-galactosidase
MNIPKRTACLLLATVTFALSALAGDPSFYVKKSSWYESMRVSREALANKEAVIHKLEQKVLGPWYMIGPFPSVNHTAFYDVFPPEREIALDKAYEHGKFSWKKQPGWENGKVIELPHVNYSATYLYRSISVPRDTGITLYLGSDDGIKVWVNQRLVLQDSATRGAGPNQDTAQIFVKAGKNELLMKINNGEGAYAFYFSLNPYTIDDLWKLVERDFHSAGDIQEISWERQDGIWGKGWKPGDLRDLASRYVVAYENAADTSDKTAREFAARTKNLSDLQKVREIYLKARHRELTDLLPLGRKESLLPRINGAKVFGVRPGHPFLFRIAATGERPLHFRADKLPAGLMLDTLTGQITGVVQARGEYPVKLHAWNRLGSTERDFRIVVGDRIALTPPLGWTSWNCFASAVDDQKVRQAAEAMVKSGLINHGWTYINIDDCWSIEPGSKDPMTMGIPRDANGMINSNRKFPNMKALSDYVHALGLKMGIYSSPGPLTCAGFTASYHHELDDARRFGQWGIDYLKYDWCSYGQYAHDTARSEYQKPYRVMRAALDSVDRDIVYSLCQYGMDRVWEWGDEVGGNCWRTTGDITDTWQSMSGIGFSQDGHERYAGPGHWNDPDMLVVGQVGWGPRLHPTRLTPNEQVTHITLWSLLCSPLLIGCDMTRMDDFTTALLTNDEVLDVNQDPLGNQARRVSVKGTEEVWGKQMEDGSLAVGLFNRGEHRSNVTITWSDLGLTGRQNVRDLWLRKDVGAFEKEFTAPVPRHGAVLLRIEKARAEVRN